MSSAGNGHGLTGAQLDRVCPFHFVVDRDLTLLQVGSSLSRRRPTVAPGVRMDDAFEIIRPAVTPSFEALSGAPRSLVLLQHRPSRLKLRGELLVDEDAGRIVFVGGPSLDDASDLAEHGLILNDFAISDDTVDSLMLVQTKNILIEDVSRLVKDVEAKRVELASANRALQARVHELQRLITVARVLGETTEVSEALRRMCRETVLLTGADTGAAYLLDRRRGLVVPVAGYRVPPEVRRLAEQPIRDLPFADTVFGAAEIIWSDDVAEDPRLRAAPFRRYRHQSCVIVPLSVDGVVSGALHIVWWTRRRAPDQAELDTLRAIGEQAGAALRTGELLDALRRRAQRFRALVRLTQLMSASLDLDAVLAEVVRQAAELMEVPNASFWLMRHGGELEVVAFSDPALARDYPSRRLAVGVGGVGWVAQQRGMLEVADVFAPGSPIAHLDWWQRHGLTSFTGVPVRQGDELIGVLALNDRRPRQLDVEDRELLGAFVTQAAIGIRNASLYSESVHAREEAETASRVKDDFLATMSHELRTPLNAILGLTGAMQEEVQGPLAPPQRRALQTVERSGRHLLALVNDLLDLARIGAGRLPLERTPVAVDAVCREAVQMVLPQAEQKRLRVALEAGSDVGTVEVNERRLRQVLINLLANAVKFTPEGGSLGLAAAGDADTVRITVWDTGIGIRPADFPRLFQPFSQLDSRLHREFPGAGLGLALSRRLVELHGGSITVDSAGDRGTRFVVVLPRRAPAASTGTPADALPDNSADPREALPAWQGGEPTVLLVEDDEATAQMLHEYLGHKGYRVVVGRRGDEVLDLARRCRPDVILMDVQLPGIDGLELTRQLRATDDLGGTPIIVLTAFAMAGDRERCLAAGADDYLAKPVNLQELTRRLGDTVGC